MKNRKRLTIVIAAVVGLLLAAAVSYPLYDRLTAEDEQAKVAETSYSELLTMVAEGKLKGLTFFGARSAAATAKDGTTYRLLVPESVAADLARSASQKGLVVEFKSEEFIPYETDVTAETVLAVGGNLLIFGLLGALFVAYGVKGGMLGRSKAKLASPTDSDVRFADVAGCDAEKAELMEVVSFLRDPGKFARLGGKVPTGVIMSGPPGTGKTMMARAVAGEAGVPFFSISGSDFVEMYVGVGAKRVREAFAQAKKKAPCILFIDEIDAVGRARSSGMAGGVHEEREQTLNQLLVEMDGFKANSGVIVIAATNRPDILDAALMRPGRFSRHIVLPNPDLAGREKILSVHAGKVRLAHDIDLHAVARGTPGFSGADLSHLVNEAAILAAREDCPAIGSDHMERAKDRIIMGNERQTILTEEDRRMTAFHEAGHALVALHSPASDPIHKVTIVPRGQALGMVVRLPERDQPAWRRSKLEADLAVAMGGRAAEELIYGDAEVTTGASGDIEFATGLAWRMVTEWGMSDAIGMVAHTKPEDRIASEATRRVIDAEVKELIADARDRALHILRTHRHQLDLLTETLLERESLTGAEVRELLSAPLHKAAEAA